MRKRASKPRVAAVAAEATEHTGRRSVGDNTGSAHPRTEAAVAATANKRKKKKKKDKVREPNPEIKTSSVAKGSGAARSKRGTDRSCG